MSASMPSMIEEYRAADRRALRGAGATPQARTTHRDGRGKLRESRMQPDFSDGLERLVDGVLEKRRAAFKLAALKRQSKAWECLSAQERLDLLANESAFEAWRTNIVSGIDLSFFGLSAPY